jgi:hypothetical protein
MFYPSIFYILSINFKRVTTVDFLVIPTSLTTLNNRPPIRPPIWPFSYPIQYNQNVFLIIDKNTIVMCVQCSVASAP